MRCLFCGKGIGPIRQLRDLEFCSQAHRDQFRERYRQQLYEALAPEPAPTRVADFRERRVSVRGPVPRAALNVLTTPEPTEIRPIIAVEAGRVNVYRPGCVLGPVSLSSHPVWQQTIAARPLAVSVSPFTSGVQPLVRPDAGATQTTLVAINPAAHPASTATAIASQAGLPPSPASLPEAARPPAPANAGMLAPQMHVAAGASRPPSFTAPVSPAVRSLVTLQNSAAVTPPKAPAEVAPIPQVKLSPATILSRPRPQDASPLAPVAIETPAIRNISVILPQWPTSAVSTMLASAQPTPALPHVSQLTPIVGAAGVRPALPDIQLALPTGEQIEAATRSPLGTAQMLPSPDPRPAQPLSASPAWEAVRAEAAHAGPHIEYAAAPMGALAGIVASADSPLPAVPTNEATRSRMEPARVATPIVNASHEWHALTAVIAPAPPRKIVDLQPAAARAATPVWDEGRLSTRDVPLAPLPGVALPTVDCLPQLADALSAPGFPLPAHVGRAVRSCAVLWTLRLGRLCSPEFAAHPIRAKFNDLLRSDIGGLWVRDAGDPIRRKSNLRVLKGRDGLRSGKRIWQFVGAAAAALLLAGVLRPQIAPKGAGGSASWRQIPVRQWITAHATRDFADDFRTGLNQWKSVQAKWPKGWSYNADGFMHPGQLALFRPSLGLTDYRFEFLAQIENKSVDWVVRAHDAENYYALKFTVLQPGPRPLLGMVRYAVIGGAKSSRVLTPLRMMIHANTPYRVTVDVKGDRYRTYIEGQEADFWTEDRLKTGGVGFFSESGERARVYWVKVESHGDLLGRICGLLSGKSSEDAGNKEKEAMDYRRAGTDDAKVASGVEVADLAGNTAQEGRISRVLSKAASLHLDGKIEDAARELARAIDAGERHPALYFALGQLQYELQQYLPASQSYAQAALLQPLHPTAHFNTGVCQGRLERWAEAAESFKQAISNDPARTEAHLALGACLVQLGRHNEALDAYDRFLARHPDNDEALFGKAVALQKRDRITEAVELYRRILNRNPRSEEALSNLVSLSLANQDYEQVRKYAQRLVEVQPKSQVAFEGLAGAAFAAGDHMAAAGYSRQLAELSPQVFENWFNLGVACHKAGDLSNAAGAYAHATQVQTASPQAHLNLGVALQEQGDLKGARKAYERALEIDPKLPGVHWNLGLVHEQSGDFEAAEKLYAQVPENSPDSDDAAFRIGHLRLQRADHRGAIQAFEGCLRKRSAWPEARLNLGIAHWRFGDKEAARTCFEELTSSGCDSKEALRGLAALSLEHQDYDKAFEIYRQLLDGGDRSPELLYNAALICQKRGEPEDAAVLYKEALRADPQFGEALLNLGHALMSMGNEFEARSCWRKAVIAKPELAQRYFEPAQAS